MWFSFVDNELEKGIQSQSPPLLLKEQVSPQGRLWLNSRNKIILDIKIELIMESAGWHLPQMKGSDMDGFWQISSCHTGAC